MVDLNLLEKFLLSILPDDAKNPLIDTFLQIRENRLNSFGTSLGRARSVLESDDLEQPYKFFFVNGVITGILIASFATTKEDKQMFENYLEQHSRNLGENVVDFTAKRSEQHGKF